MRGILNITDKKISYNSLDDKDILHFIDTVRLGIAFDSFYSFVKKAPFSLNEWSVFLNMSERTMQRYKRESKSFDPIFSEKILQITLLYNLGVDVFGDKDRFNAWLETNNLALGGIRPKDLLDNTFGINLLKDELTRIEQGVLA